MVALLRLHWKDRFGDMSRTRLLPRLENLPGLTNLRKTTCQGGFFVSGSRDYDDRKRISRKTGDFCVHSSVALRPLHDFSPTPVTPLNTIPNTNFGDVPIAKSHNKNLIATISRLCGIKLIGTLPLHLTMICSFNEYRTRHQLFQTRPLVAAFLIKAA